MAAGEDDSEKGSGSGTKPEAGPARPERALIIDTPLRQRPPGTLSLQRLTPQAFSPAPATITRLRIDAPARPERTPRLYETIRIVDLARFRQSLRRQRNILAKKGSDLAINQPRRAELLALLDERYRGAQTIWPDVVVIRRPESGVIETNYALLGGTIYLGAHLSTDWTEGRESDRFYETLHQALLEQGRMHASQFEPVRTKPGTDPGQ